MKPFVILCVLAIAAVTFTPLGATAHKAIHVRHDCHNDDLFRGDNVNVDIDDGSIVFTHQNDNETVEITENGDLIVNGSPVRLARDERKLVEDYYETFDGIINEAKEIGLEGAKIGVKGATLGISAAISALVHLADGRDADDVQIEVDRKSERIERMADRLEKRADRLEAKTNRLEEMHNSLRSTIDELDDLGWF
jgi:flagellar capping protein FliD